MSDDLDMPLNWQYDDWLAAAQRTAAEEIETVLKESGRPAYVVAVETRADTDFADTVDVTVRTGLTEEEAEALERKRRGE